MVQAYAKCQHTRSMLSSLKPCSAAGDCRGRKHSYSKRSPPKYDGKTIEEYPSNQDEAYEVPTPRPGTGYVAPPPSMGGQYGGGAEEHTTEGHRSRGTRKYRSSPKREEPEEPEPAPRGYEARGYEEPSPKYKEPSPEYEQPAQEYEEPYPVKKVKHHKSDRYKRSSYENQATPADGKDDYEAAAPPKKKRHHSKKQHKEPEHRAPEEMAEYSTPTPAPTPAHQPEYMPKPPTAGQPPKPYPKEPESYDPSNYARYPVEDELDYEDYAVAVTGTVERDAREHRANINRLWSYRWPRKDDSAQVSIQAEPYRMYTGISKPLRHAHRSHHQV